jgi:hypothetical protein
MGPMARWIPSAPVKKPPGDQRRRCFLTSVLIRRTPFHTLSDPMCRTPSRLWAHGSHPRMATSSRAIRPPPRRTRNRDAQTMLCCVKKGATRDGSLLDNHTCPAPNGSRRARDPLVVHGTTMSHSCHCPPPRTAYLRLQALALAPDHHLAHFVRHIIHHAGHWGDLGEGGGGGEGFRPQVA